MLKNRFKNHYLTLLLAPMLLIFFTGFLFKPIAQPQIVKISDMSINVYKNASFTLPKAVSAGMSNQSKKQMPVKWNPVKAKTDKAGTFKFYGTVKGYNNKVLLKLMIKEPSISIKNIQDLSDSIKQNKQYVLPNSIDTQMSDGSIKKLAVAWDNTNMVTSKAGTCINYGKVIGYDKKIKLTLQVLPFITKVEEINAIVKQKESFVLPQTIAVILSDDTTKSVPVIWKQNTVDTSKSGVSVYYGTVDGYEGEGKLTLNILPITENKPITTEGFNYVSADSEYAYSIIKEITDSKYNGRKSGTDGYNKATGYISEQFRNIGLKPCGDNNTYLQNYSLTMAEFKSMPTLTINGKQLKYMEDFKIHSSSNSGMISGNQIIFVGYGYEEDYSGIDVSGKVVMFLCDPKPNTNASGILDRALLAKKKGAVASLIVTSEYSPLKDYEHIVNGSNVDVVSFYISSEVAKTVGVNFSTIKVQAINATVTGSIELSRTAAVASNVLGMLEGRDPSKTVVVSANLDGFGVSPDGTIYQGAGMNASGVGTVLALSKYYSEQKNKPLYNILFALFGSKAQGLEGSKYFVDKYPEINKVIANFNVYDVGSTVDQYIAAVPKSDPNLFKSVSKIISATENSESTYLNLGFMDVSSFKMKNIPSMWLRASNSEKDSSKDTLDTIKRETLTQTLIYMKEIIGDYQANTLVSSFNESRVTKVFNTDINKNLNQFDTEHYTFYYEDSYTSAMPQIVEKCETVYENVMWWNYYPAINQKIRIYLVNGYEDSARVVHRTDKYGNNEGNQGLQQPNEFSLSIVAEGKEVLGVLAHELNHVIASNKDAQTDNQLSSKDVDNQEIHGRVYPYVVGAGDGYAEGRSMFASFIGSDLNDITAINWDDYTGENYYRTIKISMDEWRRYALRMSTFDYFVWQKYGRDVARNLQYDFYTNDKISFKEVLAKEKFDFTTMINDWKAWYEKGSNGSVVASGTPGGTKDFTRVGTSKFVEITKFQQTRTSISNIGGFHLMVDGKEVDAIFNLTDFNTIVVVSDELDGKTNFKIVIKPNSIVLNGSLNAEEITFQN